MLTILSRPTVPLRGLVRLSAHLRGLTRRWYYHPSGGNLPAYVMDNLAARYEARVLAAYTQGGDLHVLAENARGEQTTLVIEALLTHRATARRAAPTKAAQPTAVPALVMWPAASYSPPRQQPTGRHRRVQAREYLRYFPHEGRPSARFNANPSGFRLPVGSFVP